MKHIFIALLFSAMIVDNLYTMPAGRPKGSKNKHTSLKHSPLIKKKPVNSDKIMEITNEDIDFLETQLKKAMQKTSASWQLLTTTKYAIKNGSLIPHKEESSLTDYSWFNDVVNEEKKSSTYTNHETMITSLPVTSSNPNNDLFIKSHVIALNNITEEKDL